MRMRIVNGVIMSEAEREELGYQYSPSRWSTRLPADVIVDAHSEAIISATKTARETLQCDLGIEYLEPGGPVLDIYHPQSTSGLLGDVVFVWYHGGYWVAFGVEHAGVAAVPLTKHGATVVAVGYTLAPKANMTRIVEECRESAVFLRKRFPDKRIFVGGHSAGAHLAATLMITDWKQNGMETFPFSGAVLLGGLYDLTPLKNMFCDDDLHFTPEEISQFSPLLQADRLAKLPSGFRCLVARGEEESSGFEKQSQEFIQTLLEHGVDYTSGVIKGSDHFEYTNKLHEEEYILTGMIIKFMSPKN